jgi:hypothetical protein
MKWSDEQVSMLRELCLAEKSNAEIAKTLNVDIGEIYAKRSQLGITIPKIRAMKGKTVTTINPEFEKAAQKMDDELPQDCKSCHYWVCCCVGTDNKVKGCKHHVTALAREHDQLYIAKREFMLLITGKLPQSDCCEIKALIDSKIPDSWKI